MRKLERVKDDKNLSTKQTLNWYQEQANYHLRHLEIINLSILHFRAINLIDSEK